MTREIRKHALAESDLIGIWEYTFHEWDAAQADKYLDELDDGIKELGDNPEMGAKQRLQGFARKSSEVLSFSSKLRSGRLQFLLQAGGSRGQPARVALGWAVRMGSLGQSPMTILNQRFH